MLKIKVNGKQIYTVTGEKNKRLLNGQQAGWDIVSVRDRHFHIIKDNRSYKAEVLAADPATKSFVICINGNKYTAEAKNQYDELLRQLGMENLSSSKVNEIKAPMPGLVLRLIAEAGQALKKGDSVLVLEAMKMENILKAPGEGIIKQIKVKAGDKVEKNEVLLVLE